MSEARAGRRGAAAAVALAAGMVGWAAGCAPAERGPEMADLLRAGVPIELAEYRKASISELAYEVSLSIPAAREEAITGSVVARFEHATGGQDVIFDFAQPADHVLGVSAGGEPIEYRTHGEHVIVPAASVRVGANEFRIDFVAGDGSLNRNDDYLYTLFVPARARVAMPLFDQPDLKARIAWTLEVPTTWEALANGPLVERTEQGDRATWRFAASEPISSYVFAFAAGRFEVAEAERDGRTMRMLYREPDAEKVARNLEAIFDLHGAALEWLEEYTGIEYPFAKFDFAAIPAFQYGGMEHPGAIFYRDRSLFLDESATQNQLLGRASLIAHETAHMWFGNLVTMEWFNDVWMKEVFANFMAAKIVNPSFPEVDHDLRFLLAHYPSAYGVDRTAGANPIRQELDNLDDAGSLYGAIIYQKAPIVMKQLELLMGEEPFRDGLREYLGAHRYDNATWPDLVAVMDARSEEDIVAWSRVWVNEPGRPDVAVRLETGNDDTVERLVVSQSDPADRGRLWNQRMTARVGLPDGTVRELPFHLREATTEVPGAAGLPRPSWVLVNGRGVGYGNFVLEASTLEHLSRRSLRDLPGPRARAVAMLALYDGMLDGTIDPGQLGPTPLTAAADPEEDELNVARFLQIFEEIWWRYMPPEIHLATPAQATASAADGVEEVLWERVLDAPSARLKATYFNAWRDVLRTDAAIDRLRAIWSGELVVEGLPLSTDDLTAIAEALAVRGVADAETILDVQRERIDDPDRLARFDFIRPALSADISTRDAFFESLRDPANREHEPWVLSALSGLHHPLRARESERYILPSLEMIEEIQRTGDIFFPLGWLSATLGGHRSPEAAAIVEGFLEENPDLPPRLRGKLLQAADPLFRAARISAGN